MHGASKAAPAAAHRRVRLLGRDLALGIAARRGSGLGRVPLGFLMPRPQCRGFAFIDVWIWPDPDLPACPRLRRCWGKADISQGWPNRGDL